MIRTVTNEKTKKPVVITTSKKDLGALRLLIQHWDKRVNPPSIKFPSGLEITVYPISGVRAIGEVFNKLKRCARLLYSI